MQAECPNLIFQLQQEDGSRDRVVDGLTDPEEVSGQPSKPSSSARTRAGTRQVECESGFRCSTVEDRLGVVSTYAS